MLNIIDKEIVVSNGDVSGLDELGWAQLSLERFYLLHFFKILRVFRTSHETFG